jgi:hypothetical protein
MSNNQNIPTNQEPRQALDTLFRFGRNLMLNLAQFVPTDGIVYGKTSPQVFVGSSRTPKVVIKASSPHKVNVHIDKNKKNLINLTPNARKLLRRIMSRSPAEIQLCLDKLSPNSKSKFNKIAQEIRGPSPSGYPNPFYTQPRDLSGPLRSPRRDFMDNARQARSVSPNSTGSGAPIFNKKPRRLSPNELLGSSRSSPQCVSSSGSPGPGSGCRWPVLLHRPKVDESCAEHAVICAVFQLRLLWPATTPCWLLGPSRWSGYRT